MKAYKATVPISKELAERLESDPEFAKTAEQFIRNEIQKSIDAWWDEYFQREIMGYDVPRETLSAKAGRSR